MNKYIHYIQIITFHQIVNETPIEPFTYLQFRYPICMAYGVSMRAVPRMGGVELYLVFFFKFVPQQEKITDLEYYFPFYGEIMQNY